MSFETDVSGTAAGASSHDTTPAGQLQLWVPEQPSESAPASALLRFDGSASGATPASARSIVAASSPSALTPETQITASAAAAAPAAASADLDAATIRLYLKLLAGKDAHVTQGVQIACTELWPHLRVHSMRMYGAERISLTDADPKFKDALCLAIMREL